MRLHHLRLRGITEAFPNEVCVDFDSLGEGLVAIVGENGSSLRSRPPAAKGSFDLRSSASGFVGLDFRQHAG